MGKFFLDQEMHRVTFPDGQWCDIKKELTRTDKDYIISKMVGTKVDKPNPEISLNLGKLPLLQRSVVAWSFSDEQNNPIPVTPENINNLRSKYSDRILDEIEILSKEASSFLAI